MKMIYKQEACRDARFVRPLKTPRAFASTTMLFACHSYCADARTYVYWLTFLMERTHEPCVPTCLSWLYWCAKWLRWQVARVHIGMHGSCVRSKRWVHSLQQPCYLLVIHLARTHEPMHIDLHSQRSGRTNRASLHASCLQIIFIIGLILKVKVQCLKVKVKVPTCLSWAYCNVQTSKFKV